MWTIQKNVSIEGAQEEWDSYGNHDTDQSDFHFRTKAKGGEVDCPDLPVLVQQDGERCWRRRHPKTVTTPQSVLKPNVCQARCREKQEHVLVSCPKYLSLNLGQRWKVVLKRKLCQFCLEADQRCVQCPVETHCRGRTTRPTTCTPTPRRQ
jgi:hypothetical protein